MKTRGHAFQLRRWAAFCAASAALFAACGGSTGSTPPFDPFSKTWTSVCQPAAGTNGFHYFISFNQTNGTFRGNSASSYSGADCSGTAGRRGINILSGTYTIGNTVTATGGLAAVQANFVYSSSTQSNRTSFTPSVFDLVYVDPVTHIVYLGQKTASRPGTSAGTRPIAIDFANAWTPN